MFKVLLMKEIQDSINNYKFPITLVLCLFLIPLGTFVSLREYEQRLADYRQEMSIYQESAQGNIYWSFSARGFRPPSALSFLAGGLEDRLPTFVSTDWRGNYGLHYDNELSSPVSTFFGKLDLQTCVGFVLSILALVFMFSSVSGEKEKGTLKLLISHSVPRSKIYAAKVIGNFIIFTVPFMLSLLVSLVVISFSSSISLFSAGGWTAVAVFTGLSLLFILLMLNLGIMISSRTDKSITSVIALLFIWIMLAFVVPKASPMVAEALFPIPTAQVVNLQKEAVRKDLEEELKGRRAELMKKVMAEYGIQNQYNLSDAAHKDYRSRALQIEHKYEILTSQALKKIDDAYESKKQVQSAIAISLSRCSPVSCFTYLASELAGTSLLELENFKNAAGRFQQQVKETVYDNYSVEWYDYPDGSGGITTPRKEGSTYDPKTAPVPVLTGYSHVTVAEVLSTQWIDILLLALYAVVLFAAGLVSFNRYDVR
ncbi:ABC transporter permease [bacterium]|nr:ABC transporter permease [bacterium]